MLLKHAFGLSTWSHHGDADRHAFGSDGLAQLVGHQYAGVEGEDLVLDLKDREGFHIVKTHDHPPTDDPCIFVVRDGRAAVVSYWHFLQDFYASDLTLEAVINGGVFAGSWSDHYIAWQPKIRPHTLLLRYEDITADPEQAVKAIASFIGVPPCGTLGHDFTNLRRMNGKFFRSGSNARNILELAGHEEIFMRQHGRVMQDLGYC